jgi:formate/nitrite transporter FocA (FNT family)
VGAPEPEEIFERTRIEGERRLSRPLLELASTAAAAGIDVAFGIVALGTITALFAKRFGTDVGQFFGAIGFGTGFVFIVVGRSELFTENFLVPLAALRRERASWVKLGELWTVSPVLNILGGALLIVAVTAHGVLPRGTGRALVGVAGRADAKSFLAAFLSAIAAGALITLMTWMVEGQESMGVRVAVAWVVGALVTLGGFNHVIVSTLELLIGIRYGASIGWDRFFAGFGTALLGNMIGGIGLVTLTRFSQARGAGRASQHS